MTKIGENTNVTLDLKTIGIIVGFTISLATTYVTIQASVAKNSEDIETISTNSVNPVEFQYKDELVRSTIKRVEEKTDVLSQDVQEVKGQLEKIDQRLYELSRK